MLYKIALWMKSKQYKSLGRSDADRFRHTQHTQQVMTHISGIRTEILRDANAAFDRLHASNQEFFSRLHRESQACERDLSSAKESVKTAKSKEESAKILDNPSSPMRLLSLTHRKYLLAQSIIAFGDVLLTSLALMPIGMPTAITYAFAVVLGFIGVYLAHSWGKLIERRDHERTWRFGIVAVLYCATLEYMRCAYLINNYKIHQNSSVFMINVIAAIVWPLILMFISVNLAVEEIPLTAFEIAMNKERTLQRRYDDICMQVKNKKELLNRCMRERHRIFTGLFDVYCRAFNQRWDKNPLEFPDLQLLIPTKNIDDQNIPVSEPEMSCKFQKFTSSTTSNMEGSNHA